MPDTERDECPPDILGVGHDYADYHGRCQVCSRTLREHAARDYADLTERIRKLLAQHDADALALESARASNESQAERYQTVSLLADVLWDSRLMMRTRLREAARQLARAEIALTNRGDLIEKYQRQIADARGRITDLENALAEARGLTEDIRVAYDSVRRDLDEERRQLASALLGKGLHGKAKGQ